MQSQFRRKLVRTRGASLCIEPPHRPIAAARRKRREKSHDYDGPTSPIKSDVHDSNLWSSSTLSAISLHHLAAFGSVTQMPATQ
jgi:hypothetical protein